MTRLLSDGIYRLSDVSRYARIPPSTVRTWFKHRSDGRGRGPVFESDHEHSRGEFTVSFLNLIEAYVADYFRKAGVSSATIRKTQTILQDELETRHPFAHADLKTDGKRIMLNIAERVSGQLVEVISRQRWFPEWRNRLLGIDYGKFRRVAEKWTIFRGVEIDPKVSFGSPIVKNTAISTWIINNQYEANDHDAEVVSKLYGIRRSDVMNAVAFEASLDRSAA